MHDVTDRLFPRDATLLPLRGETRDIVSGGPLLQAPATGRRSTNTTPKLALPALFAIALAVASVATGLDWRLADALYAWEGGQWSLRHAPAIEALHVAGRNASAALWCLVVAAFAVACLRPRLRAWRRPLAGLALSVLLATSLVAWIKSWSNMDCPWDLVRYGGARAYIDLFSLRPAGMPRGGCFPAGHASGGYAWMASYFFLLATRPAWRWRGLAAGLALGLGFGVSQQLRGAHFLSHDLSTAALCWLVAVAVHGLLRQPPVGAHPGATASCVETARARVRSYKGGLTHGKDGETIQATDRVPHVEQTPAATP